MLRPSAFILRLERVAVNHLSNQLSNQLANGWPEHKRLERASGRPSCVLQRHESGSEK
jgi:hypothetical protein